MNMPKQPSDPSEWQPATSRPGEVFTVEGRIKAMGALARGMKNDDPRLRNLRRPMVRTATWLMVAVVAAFAIGIAVTALS